MVICEENLPVTVGFLAEMARIVESVHDVIRTMHAHFSTKPTAGYHYPDESSTSDFNKVIRTP